MKRFFLFFVIIAAIAISLTSCQKDFTVEDDPNPPVDTTDTTTDSIYLDKIVELDSVSATEVDTITIIQYQYDAAKRVVSMKLFWDDGGGMALMDEYYYFYNGSDTLPSRTVNHSYDYGGGTYHKDTTSSWHSYSAGKLIRDSSISVATNLTTSPTDTTVTTYTYTASQIIGFTVDREGNRYDPTGINNNTYLNMDTAYLDSRGNVITSKQHLTDDNSTYNVYLSSEYTYDTNPSPFSLLSNFKTLSPTGIPESWYYEVQTPNNRISEKYESDPVINYTGFIYNANNLITSMRMPDTGAGSTTVVKYFYRSL